MSVNTKATRLALLAYKVVIHDNNLDIWCNIKLLSKVSSMWFKVIIVRNPSSSNLGKVL